MATPEFKWPRNQTKYRNQASERVARARSELKRLMDGKLHREEEIVLVIAKAQIDLGDALRWLERAGACTQPEEL